MDVQVSIIDKEDRSLRELRCRVEDRVVLGRGPECGIVVEGPAISREHLLVENGDGNLMVTDLSANGCWINGARIPKSRRTPVRDSDTVEVPGFEIRIRRAEAAPPPVPELPARVQPAITPAEQPAPPAGMMRFAAPVLSFTNSFTRSEKFTALVSLLSLGLVAMYYLS